MPRTVLIVGGGLAGLVAALRLSAHRYAVTLIEQDRRLGGRLVAGASDGSWDAIPSVIMGHHVAMLGLLKELGTGDRAAFSNSLRLEFQLPGGHLSYLTHPWLPAPFHTLASILLFGGLSWSDRWRLLDVIERSWEGDPPLPQDLDERTAEEWLAGRNQSDRARAEVWTPLARFLLGDDLATVSAASFVSALMRCFFGARRHGRLAVPSEPLRTLLIEPLAVRLAYQGVTVRVNTAAVLLELARERISGVRLEDGATLAADWYILALPHHRLTAILPERALTHYAYFQQLTHLSDSPALTVHLHIDRAIQAPRIVLFARRTFHWLVARPAEPRGGTLVSLVVTGQAELFNRTDEELVSLALEELAYAYPGTTGLKLLASQVIRDRHAFLTMSPGTGIHRPLARSPIPNLLLAGDWTDTGLPATLESAVISGARCADLILAARA